MDTTLTIPTRPFGSTGRHVTHFGLGGEGVLRTFERYDEAAQVVETAIRLGVSYFDSARAYAGSEGYYGSVWRRMPEARDHVFITSKSASRDAAGARRDLETTLKNLAVAHIDLWQLHDLRSEGDLAAITRKGGALEAFQAAVEDGKVRHIGLTGHHDPHILKKAIQEIPAASVLLPINPVEGVIGGFMTDIVAEARAKGMAVIGMKVLGQGALLDPVIGLEAETLIRYALGKDADTLILGCWTPEEVQMNVRIASEARPLSAPEEEALLAKIRPHARQLAYYRGVI